MSFCAPALSTIEVSVTDDLLQKVCCVSLLTLESEEVAVAVEGLRGIGEPGGL